MDRVFVWSADEKNFVYQLVHSYLPGTMDTSLVSTDYINNPRTMNAVYLLGERLGRLISGARRRLEGGERNNKQLPASSIRPTLPGRRACSRTARIRSASSAALNRVYINIGLYSEDWTTHFNPFFGFKPITPILIRNRREDIPPIGARPRRARRSWPPSWSRAGQPDKLADAPGRRQISHRGRRHADAGQARLRRNLRALPFEQAAATRRAR